MTCCMLSFISMVLSSLHGRGALSQYNQTVKGGNKQRLHLRTTILYKERLHYVELREKKTEIIILSMWRVRKVSLISLEY